MGNRGDRRDRTWRKARGRQQQHLSLVHPHGVVGCACERSVWFFDRRRALGCDCRRRRSGRPRVAGGMCRIGARDRIYQARREWRERALRVVRRGELET